MTTMQSPSKTFTLPAPKGLPGTCPTRFITALEMQQWKEARRLKLLERKRYWENCLAKQS